MPCVQPFCPSVVVSWLGSLFSKPRPEAHEAPSQPHPDDLRTQLSKAFCQGRATYHLSPAQSLPHLAGHILFSLSI